MSTFDETIRVLYQYIIYFLSGVKFNKIFIIYLFIHIYILLINPQACLSLIFGETIFVYYVMYEYLCLKSNPDNPNE